MLVSFRELIQMRLTKMKKTRLRMPMQMSRRQSCYSVKPDQGLASHVEGQLCEG